MKDGTEFADTNGAAEQAKIDGCEGCARAGFYSKAVDTLDHEPICEACLAEINKEA